MSFLRSLHLPRPKRFLYFMPLSLAADVIALALLVNKVSGLYGLFALLTGAPLSVVQLTMYIYSLFVAAILVYFLIPGIMAKRPIECVAFAWVYVVDSVVNAAFTGLFGVGWFLTGPGAVHVPASGSGSLFRGNATVPAGASEDEQVPVGTVGGEDGAAPAAGILPAESLASITIIVVLWLVRVYFCLIVLSFARKVVRGEDTTSTSSLLSPSSSSSRYAPFRPYHPSGISNISLIDAEPGWKGKLGRALVGVNRPYWEGDAAYKAHHGDEETGGGEGQNEEEEWLRLRERERDGESGARGRWAGRSAASSRSASVRGD
ncbi:Inositolphosphorylceramide synthase subunit Kei1-domain-containing protein [Kalaharituber pfeilii]|nr:Inositolphosphorylceramide synthase subunit Kei1-domain-containing protein [Kalaharituber pfeilii]